MVECKTCTTALKPNGRASPYQLDTAGTKLAGWSLGLIIALGVGCGSDALPLPAEPDTSGTVWALVSELPEPRWSVGTAAHGDFIYIAGGLVGPGIATSSVLRWAPGVDRWETIRSLPEPLFGVVLVVAHDTLFALAASKPDRSVSSRLFLAYDPATDEWLERPDLIDPRNHFAAAAVGNTIVVAGGEVYGENTHTPIIHGDSVLVYDFTTNAWRFGRPVATPRIFGTGVATGSRFLLFGGAEWFSTGLARRVETYDPVTDVWTTVDEDDAAAGASAVTVGASGIHVLGGYDESGHPASRHRAFDPATGTWSALPRLPYAREFAAAVTFDGILYVIGGRRDSRAATADIHAYDHPSNP